MSHETENSEPLVRTPIMKASSPYHYHKLGSFDTTQNMLIRQHCFPAEWVRDVDHRLSGYSDHAFRQDYVRAQRISSKYAGWGGPQNIEFWARKTGPRAIMSFLTEILNAEKHYPEVKWTGFRILGSVNRSNGYKVFFMELFANVSGVETYSRDVAPNVERGDL